MAKQLQIAVVGATGTVGKQVLAALEEKELPAQSLTVFGSEQSKGSEVEYSGESLEVEQISEEAFRGMSSVVLACPAATAKPLALAAQQAGAWVVDLSGAFRTELGVPLVVGDADVLLTQPFTGRIVEVAMPTAQALFAALEPVRATVGVQSVDLVALLGAASAGRRGIVALEKQTSALLNGIEVEDPTVFPHRLAFNLIPQVGTFDRGNSSEELALKLEVARRWGSTRVSCTMISVPFFHGTMISVSAQLERPLEADALRTQLKALPGVKVIDSPDENIYPMPMLVTADSSIHLGRVRSEGKSLQLIAAFDNAGRAAEVAASLALKFASRP
jgi:aspartate-semialdehyde dehydrogenase